MLIGIRGAGDIASGVACRLHRSGFALVMTELPQPAAIRRSVCFSEAILASSAVVEDITARLAGGAAEAREIAAQGDIAVLADPSGELLRGLSPAVVIDAILAKKNLGTAITDAPAVIALGPGFMAGRDCHAVVETMRGHTLGRVYYAGGALPNTGVPGSIGGFTVERVLRAPAAGEFRGLRQIGDTVTRGETIAFAGGQPIRAAISGTLRGLLPDGIAVSPGMKCGDIDPRCEKAHCYQVSDKALAIAGGVLEAILHLRGGMQHGI
ncbi:MAG: selenium-dependent molybdenum cofactor biosynthesis protein YqeB [Clostridia bacterium]|nr:selenium-dependent molybdenum cofactor biosynthesis protein YqeB [Clostridia bacterium]